MHAPFKHHLCFASNQPLPNLTPLAGGHLAVQGGVTLVAPPERRPHARWFVQALQALHRDVAARVVEIHDAYDWLTVQEALRQLAATHPHGCVVNVTGGSKLLAMAAWEVFRRPQDEIVYVRPADDTLTWLHPGPRSEPIGDRLTLQPWLLAHGYALAAEVPHPPPTPQQARQIHARVRQLVALAAAAARTPPPHAPGQPPSPVIHGRDFEAFVAVELQQLFATRPDQRARLQDWCGAVVIQQLDNPDIRNELDGVVLFNNRMTVLEAKTGNEASGEGAVRAIYRLSRLRQQLGGWISQGVFVSARKVSKAVQQRAADYGIVVLDLPELPRLGQHLEQALLQPNRI